MHCFLVLTDQCTSIIKNKLQLLVEIILKYPKEHIVHMIFKILIGNFMVCYAKL